MSRSVRVLFALLLLTTACATRTQPPSQPASSHEPAAATGTPSAPEPSITFDTKGVEFGPWVRRFIAQVKGKWFIPYEAMALHGHVVVTFNVQKDGSITDVSLMTQSSVEVFNKAALDALRQVGRTQPLPEAYPADKAFFTVTFYYNESPP
jgi:TonB family protein